MNGDPGNDIILFIGSKAFQLLTRYKRSDHKGREMLSKCGFETRRMISSSNGTYILFHGKSNSGQRGIPLGNIKIAHISHSYNLKREGIPCEKKDLIASQYSTHSSRKPYKLSRGSRSRVSERNKDRVNTLSQHNLSLRSSLPIW